MGTARALAVLLTWSAFAVGVGSAHAQAPGGAPADAAGPEDAAPPAADDARPQGYEPDQRGNVDEGADGMAPQDAQLYNGLEATGGDYEEPADVDSGTATGEPQRARQGLYLRAQLGYSLLDVTGLDTGNLAEGGEADALHGGLVALGAGLHLSALDLGLRVDLGLHDGGAWHSTLLADLALPLGDAGLIPSLRVGAGYGWAWGLELDDASASASAHGPVVEIGAGVDDLVSPGLSLGGGVDLGVTWLTRNTESVSTLPTSGIIALGSGRSSTGLYLRVHLDLGLDL